MATQKVMARHQRGDADTADAAWFHAANAAEDILNGPGRRTRADLRNALNGETGMQWSVLPGGDPGRRRPYLLVFVDDGIETYSTDIAFETELHHRLDQVRIYVTRLCPETEGILFFLTRSHFSWGRGGRSPAERSWHELWCRYRTIFASLRPDLTMRVAFQKQAREKHDICHFDAYGTPVGGRSLLRWWHGVSPHTRDLFRERICLIRHLGFQPDLDGVFNGPEQEEALHASAAPFLEFGSSHRVLPADKGHKGRLYLGPLSDLPLAFDGRRYNRDHGMRIHALSGARESDAEDFIWRPADMALFAQDPQLWLNSRTSYF